MSVPPLPQFSIDERAGQCKYCEYCEMNLNGPVQWERHQAGKKHKKNMLAYEKRTKPEDEKRTKPEDVGYEDNAKPYRGAGCKRHGL